MTIIALVKSNRISKKIRNIFACNIDMKWCYIGRDIEKRERIGEALGKRKRFFLKDGLHRVAAELRQPYLDLVAKLGANQKDHLNWWASRFASKKNYNSDFFLLLCYKALAMKLIQRSNDEPSLVIFLDDPWVFADLRKEANKYRRDMIFIERPYIFLEKTSCLTKGLFHRLLLMGWFFVARLLIRYHQRGEKPNILKKERRPAVCILNHAERRAFDQNGKYTDNFMPGLTELYQKNEIPHFRLYPLLFPFSTAPYVGKNKTLLWPLINDATFYGVIKRIFECWKPILNSHTLTNTIEYDTKMLLERERWIEFSSVGFNLQLIFYDALNSFFNKGWCRSIIYPFENQPWEKMLCLSADKHSIRAIGYQHASIWRFFMSQFIGKGETSFMPLPYRIITSGSYFAELYRAGGMPEDKLIVGGAWRYLSLSKGIGNGSCSKRRCSPKRTILVSLPLCTTTSESMLVSITDLVSENHLSESEVEFWVKPHPGLPISSSNVLKKLPSQFHIINGSFVEALEDADMVISSASTSGLEAFLYGKRVISYLPENLIPSGALSDMTEEGLYRWCEGEKMDANIIRNCPIDSNPNDTHKVRDACFGKICHEAWLKLV